MPDYITFEQRSKALPENSPATTKSDCYIKKQSENERKNKEWCKKIKNIFALYALIKMAAAIVTVVRRRGHRTPLQDAEQNLILVEASVCIMALVTALLAQFTAPDQADLRFGITFVTCTLVFVLTLELTVRMFLASHRALLAMRREKE